MNCNLKEEIDKLTDNYGCDAYIEVSGADKSVQQGLDILTRLGRFVCFSVFKGDVEADWSLIGTQFSFYHLKKKKKEKKCHFLLPSISFSGDVKELRVIGGHLGPHCWPKAIQMVSKKQLPLDDIITHKFPLKDYQKGIEMVLNSSKSIKVMLMP